MNVIQKDFKVNIQPEDIDKTHCIGPVGDGE